MERAVALKKLSRMLGKKLAYRVSSTAPSPEEREAAKAKLPDAVKAYKYLGERLQARSAALLDADPEYQEIKQKMKLVRYERDNLQNKAIHYKITVGTNESIFFRVEAEGDSWEDVIAKVLKKGGSAWDAKKKQTA